MPLQFQGGHAVPALRHEEDSEIPLHKVGFALVEDSAVLRAYLATAAGADVVRRSLLQVVFVLLAASGARSVLVEPLEQVFKASLVRGETPIELLDGEGGHHRLALKKAEANPAGVIERCAARLFHPSGRT